MRSRCSSFRRSSSDSASSTFLSIVAFSSASCALSSDTCVGAVRGGVAADVEGLQLTGVVGEHLRLQVVERRHRGEPSQEGARVVGDDDLADRGEVLALVLAHDGVLHLVADGLEPLVLATLVGLDRGEVLVELLELEPDVVVPLRGHLGLVVQAIDAGLDILDVGLGLGAAGHQSDGSSHRQGGQGSDESLPTVEHERAVSLASRTPTR